MALFASTQISWTEPWLFLIRIRTADGWMRRILLALGVAILVAVVIFLFQGGQRGILGSATAGLAAGAAILLLMDKSNIQRNVTVMEDRIVVDSSIGRGWFVTFKFEEITGIKLMRPDEWGKGYGGMIISTADDNFLVAVPQKVSLDTLADILHRLKLDVTLADWIPPQGDHRVGTSDEVAIDAASARGEVTVESLKGQEAPLLPMFHQVVQLVIGLGPLLIALIAAIATGVHMFLHWGDLSVVDRGIWIGGAAVFFVLAFLYLVLIGQFVAADYGVRMGRKKLPLRATSIVDPQSEQLVPIEIFDRESWTKMAAMSSDFGFLEIDRARSRLLYEGNKTRWTLPFAALRGCRIQECVVGSGADQNAEKRYFVHIEAMQEQEPWEAGMVFVRTEMGNDNAEARYKRAQLLFLQLADAIGGEVRGGPERERENVHSMT